MRPITKFMMCALAAAAMAAPAFAANYLKIGDVKSKSVADGGTAVQIQIKSWSWGANDATRSLNSSKSNRELAVSDPGASGPKATSKRQHGSVTISKPLARGSVTVSGSLPGCTVGATYPDVVLQTTYMQYELKEVMVSSCTVSGSGGGGGVPTESITLNYASYRESPTRASQK